MSCINCDNLLQEIKKFIDDYTNHETEEYTLQCLKCCAACKIQEILNNSVHEHE